MKKVDVGVGAMEEEQRGMGGNAAEEGKWHRVRGVEGGRQEADMGASIGGTGFRRGDPSILR